jgi:tRNA U38,U39,U40 pseudouridine synthase TruA
LISMLSNNNHNIDIEGTRFCIRQIRGMMTGRLETSVLKGFTRRNLQIC